MFRKCSGNLSIRLAAVHSGATIRQLTATKTELRFSSGVYASDAPID
jgi:hypothetical protein